MCTLTLLREADRVTVTMNRDDLIARAEDGPQIRRLQGATFAAPLDLQAGGAWIAVNTHGVIACLLNRYDPVPAGATSRGAIVIDAMRAADATEALARLHALSHELYAPFTCIVVTRSAQARFDWNGADARATMCEGSNPWMTTSSSWAFEDVRARREALFAATWSRADAPFDKIAAFHCKPISSGDAWAPMMKREKSHTKSVTQVELGATRAAMRYWRRERAIANGLSAPDTALSLQIETCC